MNKDTLILKDGTIIELEAGAGLGNMKVELEDLAELEELWDKITSENLKEVTIKNDAGMVCATYINLVAQKPLFRYLDKADSGKILAVFCLRQKTEMEMAIEELKAKQQILDGAVGDLGEVTSAMADQMGGEG